MCGCARDVFVELGEQCEHVVPRELSDCDRRPWQKVLERILRSHRGRGSTGRRRQGHSAHRETCLTEVWNLEVIEHAARTSASLIRDGGPQLIPAWRKSHFRE